ncbi:TIR domain-containing protein [Janthinobacterium sp. ZB1P44]|uniref:TIR domain-containing protein n=1 Tax=Janthinobacterium sp. ZB1P44 TaxID=3424192 RepID=UPI003F214368
MSKPKVFIASSVEGLNVAYNTQSNLEHDCDATVWPQGVFRISVSPLDSLVRQVENSDFAIFVFTPDDAVTMRKESVNTVRDNVIFELGLFLGRLGRERCFIVAPNVPMHIPTDLVGVTPAIYSAERDIAEIAATLGPACNEIRMAMKRLGRVHPASPELHVPVAESDNFTDDDKNILLRGWLNTAQPDIAYKFDDVDKELKVDRGTTKRLLTIVVQKMKLMKISDQSNYFFSLEWPDSETW